MNDWLSSTLIDLYYEHDWIHVQAPKPHLRELLQYTDTIVQQGPLGKPKTLYRLNMNGKTVAEFLLRQHGRQTKSKFGGLVMEQRIWHIPIRHNISVKKLKKAFKEIEKRGQVPVKIFKNWKSGQTRVVINDLDRALSRISKDILWETRGGRKEYLTEVAKFSDELAWLWTEVLDKNRSKIRQMGPQQEFVIWDT